MPRKPRKPRNNRNNRNRQKSTEIDRNQQALLCFLCFLCCLTGLWTQTCETCHGVTTIFVAPNPYNNQMSDLLLLEGATIKAKEADHFAFLISDVVT